jgi:hypothetical protein
MHKDIKPPPVNYCWQLDEMIAEQEKVLKYGKDNYRTIFAREKDIRHTLYCDTRFSQLGFANPSPLIHKMIDNCKRGRALKKKPDADEYTEFGFDQNMKLIRMIYYHTPKSSGQFEVDFCKWAYQYNGAEYVVPFGHWAYPRYGCEPSPEVQNYKNEPSPSADQIYKFEYDDDGRIERVTYFHSTSLFMELFDYSTLESEGYYGYETIYYVQGWNDSAWVDNSLLIGDDNRADGKRAAAELRSFQVYLDGKGKIREIIRIYRAEKEQRVVYTKRSGKIINIINKLYTE